MRVFTKKDIKIKLKEGYVLHKEDLLLKEDSNTTAQVNPTNPNSSPSNLNADIADAKNDSDGKEALTVKLNDYDGNPGNDQKLDLAVTGKTTADQARNMQDMVKNPIIKREMNRGTDINVRVPSAAEASMQNSSRSINPNLMKLRENSIGFSKKEMDEFLRNL